jgi:hypothetical protein
MAMADINMHERAIVPKIFFMSFSLELVGRPAGFICTGEDGMCGARGSYIAGAKSTALEFVA